MELIQLIQFKEIVECNSITNAAAKLYTSQPALSRSLKNLEYELGCKLFDRWGKRLKINKKGIILLEYVNRILTDIDELKNVIRIDDEQLSHLKIYSYSEMPLRLLTPFIVSNILSMRISSSVVSQDMLENDLLNEHCDIAVSSKFIKNKDINCFHLMRETIGISVHKENELAKKTSFCIADAKNLDFMRTNVEQEFHTRAEELCRQNGISINYAYVVDRDSLWELFNRKDLFFFSSSIYSQFKQSRFSSYNRHSRDNRKTYFLTDKEATRDIYLCYVKRNKNAVDFIKAIGENYSKIFTERKHFNDENIENKAY